jgi:hypothetical protein
MALTATDGSVPASVATKDSGGKTMRPGGAVVDEETGEAVALGDVGRPPAS